MHLTASDLWQFKGVAATHNSHGNKISFTSHIQSVDREGKDGSKGGEEEEDEDDVVIQQEAEKVAKVKRGQKTEQT